MNHKGSALLTALFVMTLVAIAVTAMSGRINIETNKTHMIVTQSKLKNVAEAGLYWGMGVISASEMNLKKVSQYGIVATLPVKFTQIAENLTLTTQIIDMQSFFNINNINHDKSFELMFVNLMSQVLDKNQQSVKNNILKACLEWISEMRPGVIKNSFKDFYKKQVPPYLVPHELFINMSEFRLIAYVSASIFNELSPYLTALPETTPINIYTASLPIIKSLGNGISQQEAEEIIALRSQYSNKPRENLLEHLAKFEIPSDQITNNSEYFLIKSVSAYNTNQFLTLNTLVKKTIDKNRTIKVIILSQTLYG